MGETSVYGVGSGTAVASVVCVCVTLCVRLCEDLGHGALHTEGGYVWMVHRVGKRVHNAVASQLAKCAPRLLRSGAGWGGVGVGDAPQKPLRERPVTCCEKKLFLH